MRRTMLKWILHSVRCDAFALCGAGEATLSAWKLPINGNHPKVRRRSGFFYQPLSVVHYLHFQQQGSVLLQLKSRY